ncbi:MAG TPA: hypothetical protein VFA60_06975 [Terriglobales bacterium]|nr:hypothetical protein [Terriglobales bacterium]
MKSDSRELNADERSLAEANNAVLIIRLFLLGVCAVFLGVPLLYVSGVVSKRTGVILLGAGILLASLLVAFGLATKRLAFYYVSRKSFHILGGTRK